MDSSSCFEDILDLFLIRLIKDSETLRCPGNDYYYTRCYNFRSIYHLFKVMKSTVVTIPEIFARFIYTQNLSANLHKEFIRKFNPSLEQLYGGVHFLGFNKKFNHYLDSRKYCLKDKIKYLDGLLYMIAKYMVTGSIPALSSDFVEENYVINNLASELLEVLIKTLENMHFRVVDRTLLSLVLFEFRKIANNQQICRQMESLSLLKTIMFKSHLFAKRNQRRVKFFRHVFENFQLQNEVLICLRQQPTNYSVFQILGFVESCLDLIGSFDMAHNTLKDSVQLIFKNYFEMIMDVQHLMITNQNQLGLEQTVNQHIQLKSRRRLQGGSVILSKSKKKQDSSTVVLEAVIRLLNKFFSLKLGDRITGSQKASMKYSQFKLELQNQASVDQEEESDGLAGIISGKLEFSNYKKPKVDWTQFGQYE